jgi:acyl-CoA reductase-like NAD-dependent aldehyde dehydrogenase
MATALRVIEPVTGSTSAITDVAAAYERLRKAYASEPYPTAAVREDRLTRLIRLLQNNSDDFAEAIHADFAGRSRHETQLADIFMTLEAARDSRRHVARWMRAEDVLPQWYMLPATARVEWQPLGVVGIIAPWNYPVNLALGPLAAALAAGNRVLLKPSELTPKTAELIARLVRETFAGDEIAVVTGGPDVAQAVSTLPLDHLLFTGSTRIGREVAKAAAQNLTPVTLELGGKSPALVHPDYPLAHAAERIVIGKLFNAGQTCIAPDYALILRGREEAFAQELRKRIHAQYPDLAGNPDYSAMSSPAGFQRMKDLLADAASKGARVESICPGVPPDERSRKMAPALIHGATPDMRVMQEEIFGPLLPIVSYASLEEAVGFVNARPRPLAFYYFDDDASRGADVLRRTHSGGACLNDTLLHFAQEGLPFGGIGESGWGRYHGIDGFQTFSHKKSVYVAGRINPTRALMSPPYGRLLDFAMRAFIGGKRLTR